MEHRLTNKQVKNFNMKVLVKSPQECWEWTATRYSNGYGNFRVGDKKMKAHRVAWLIANGSIPDGMYVLHKCNNKSCVNPNHLYIGDRYDNIRDAMKSNLLGTGMGSVKLKIGEVWLIKKLRVVLGKHMHTQYKFSATLVSKMFKVHPQTILNIWNKSTIKCRDGIYQIETTNKKNLEWR